ncbi:MerR family transcriptional regulator [Streptomyces bluensis]|uniref:helix-turn-helix domain-containing protein n=1 Tax=Streptomyces bluensis TaxID=33897 RepID=UPI003D9F7586
MALPGRESQEWTTCARDWSDVGVVAPVGRTAGGYRRYDTAGVARLHLAHTLRDRGWVSVKSGPPWIARTGFPRWRPRRQLTAAAEPAAERFWQLLCVLGGRPAPAGIVRGRTVADHCAACQPAPGARNARLDALCTDDTDPWPGGVLDASTRARLSQTVRTRMAVPVGSPYRRARGQPRASPSSPWPFAGVVREQP